MAKVVRGRKLRIGNMARYKIGDRVKVAPLNDNEGYDSFRGKTLIITHVARNQSEHPGYDSGLVGGGLYDLKEAETGESVGSSLYDYELVRA